VDCFLKTGGWLRTTNRASFKLPSRVDHPSKALGRFGVAYLFGFALEKVGNSSLRPSFSATIHSP
jgi:hypothetical protein